MPSVKVIDERGGDKRKYDLWSCVGRCELHIWKIERGTHTTFYLITDESSLEDVVEEKALEIFKSQGFQVVPPLEVKSSRTVVVKQIDPIYKEATEQDYHSGISLVNYSSQIEEIIKIPTQYDSPLIKIRFSKVRMAEYALNNGIKIFEQTIPPRALQREVYTRLDICTNCFAYDHIKPNCTKPKIARCTVCAKEGHKYFECPKEERKCINCKEEHATFDKECTVRKQTLKEKTKKEIDKESNRAKSRQNTFEERKRIKNKKWDEKAHTSLPPGAFATIITALVSATMIESKLKGSFQTTYNDVLDWNQIPRVSLPENVINKLVECQDQEGRSNRNDNDRSSIADIIEGGPFTSMDFTTTETEGEIEICPQDGSLNNTAAGHSKATEEKHKKKLKCKRKRKQTPTPAKHPLGAIGLSTTGNLSDNFSSGLISGLSEDEDLLTGEPIRKPKQSKKKTPPLNIFRGIQSAPTQIQKTPPPPEGAVHYERATCLKKTGEGPLKILQELSPIIFYPVSWNIQPREVLLKFLDGETFIHYVPPSDGSKISTRNLVRACLANGEHPEMVINFCSLQDDEWKNRFSRLYPS